ncbi:unnamed protein product [Bursaphelenchus xylophilus]|uniref:(pine wood nematode) hypothetical protein n=1 Tax=Bursaphelenchus xylophilus TaxID=6326 RepID=A0A1I7RYH9_BURXY|nr:unnamed protein product [Bursaphelenchus xylophilus]CAG9092665.1 unnamed protein product [Bursaphelenchus xylophilus]
MATNEKLGQMKLDAINDRLQGGRLYSVSTQSCCTNESISVFERTRMLFRFAMEKQSFYAHCFKLLTLFCIAVAHLVYMQPFLDSYSAVEDYTLKLNAQYPGEEPVKGQDIKHFRDQMDILADYKQNTWMCVASMCIALSTTCFFLFILPITTVRPRNVFLLAVLDLSMFAALPVLLTLRIFIVEKLHLGLAAAMRAGHKIMSAERVMNILQCTILPRERLPYCSEIVLGTIFPIILLKYLIILALLTLLYIGLAYLIEWCIRHWFPHSRQRSPLPTHSCCMTRCNKYRCHVDPRPTRQYQDKSYIPVLLPSGDVKVKPITPMASISIVPLIQRVDEENDCPSLADSIPAEPQPN